MPPDPGGDLAAMSLSDLLIVYGNWRARIPSEAPREVHRSRRLSDNAKLTEHRGAFDAIVSKIEGGEDLVPHLSKRVAVAYDPPGQNQRNQHRHDLDLLVADWGIHHLHLSATIQADGFVARTGDLLFARFTETAAYLIDVLPHNSWTEISLLESLVREWPSAELLHGSLSDLRLVSPPPSEEDRRRLRNAGVSQLVEIDGRVYMPPSQTSAGTPMEVTRRVNALIHKLNYWRQDTGARFDAHDPARQAYWRPVVEQEHCGFTDGERIIVLGRLS
jgi:hypothetical protein